MAQQLTALTAGMAIPFGGDRVTFVPPDLADAFAPGDRLVVVQDDGALLHIPGAAAELVDRAVAGAQGAFASLARAAAASISTFFNTFADRLDDDATFAAIAFANAGDVQAAGAHGRSTTRLVLGPQMRADMIAGLRGWRDTPPSDGRLVEAFDHQGWSVEQRLAPLGVVGFVFEGRPNVFADATGVLRSGNAVVFRIGSDALDTARAIMEHAVAPALAAAGLAPMTVVLLDSPARATGWALFSHPGVSLAVARGSGAAVAQLGAVARQAGLPASLHGTGGAWLVGGEAADADRFEAAVYHSLDRKVCNTLNVCCIPRSQADRLVPRFLAALSAAADRRHSDPKLHLLLGSEPWVPQAWFDHTVSVRRAGGDRAEPVVEALAEAELGTEWEWEDSPEVTLAVVDTVADAAALFNRYSPRLVATLLSEDLAEQDWFWANVDAPFVGDGFTRWVDGQFALSRPELGLSNWQQGRLFARSAVLSGDSVFTIRTRARQSDPDLHR